jgi:hypothetical protein
MIKPRLQVLDELDPCYLECDGLTSVISSLLTGAGVSHRIFIGSAKTEGNFGISPHLWIEVDDYVIDYRLRMWLGDDPSIPHGFFKKSEYSHITYSGSATESSGDREPIARVLCLTAGVVYDDLAFKLKESIQGAV